MRKSGCWRPRGSLFEAVLIISLHWKINLGESLLLILILSSSHHNLVELRVRITNWRGCKWHLLREFKRIHEQFKESSPSSSSSLMKDGQFCQSSCLLLHVAMTWGSHVIGDSSWGLITWLLEQFAAKNLSELLSNSNGHMICNWINWTHQRLTTVIWF